MAQTLKTEIIPIRRPKRHPDIDWLVILDESLAFASTGVPIQFRKLSGFLPVIVLIPKPAQKKKLGRNRPTTGHVEPAEVDLALNAAKSWVGNPLGLDTFKFGEVSGCFSEMEVYRNRQPVVLTCKEFKTLAYFIKNPRRVISRNELLNEVWGYENYPCTRTVDNHVLKLRKKLETDPAHPEHFHTVHSFGYKFLP